MAKLKVQQTGKPRNVVQKLIALKTYDVEVERKRKVWGWTWGLSLVFTILGIIAAANGPDSLVVFPVLFGAAFVVSLIIYIVHVTRDLDNRKLDTVLLLVERLSEDIPPEAQCSILLDFADYRKGGKLVSKEGGVFGPKQFQYAHSWLNFSAKLYDGNKFDIEVEQNVKRKEKPKRKYTKVKERITEKATLTIRLNPENYPNPAEVATQIPTGITNFGFTISKSIGTDKALKVAMETNPAVFVQGRGTKTGSDSELMTSDRLLGLFIQTYSGISKTPPAPAAETPA